MMLRRILNSPSWMLALACLLCATAGCAAEDGALDSRADQNWPDQATNPDDTWSTNTDTRGGTGTATIVSPAFTANMAGKTQSSDAPVEIVRGVPADIDGDGFLDLVGVSIDGDVVVKLLDPTQGVFPPFTYKTPQIIPTGFGATRLATGDFDGDGNIDVAALDPAKGILGLALNMGRGYLAAPTLFDDPILAFDDPILAFDDPILALDWIVADLDGNGTDDMAFAGGGGFRVSLFGQPREQLVGAVEAVFGDISGAAGFDDPILAFDDPILAFDDPILAMRGAAAIELDGTPGAELVVAFEGSMSGAVSIFDLNLPANFDDPILAFDDPILAFDDPILAMGTTSVPMGVTDLVVADVDMDGLDDFAALSNDGATSAITVWSSGTTFDDPILAFDDPILAFDDPILAFHAALIGMSGTYTSLETARMISAIEGGFGSNFAGASPLTMSQQLLARAPEQDSAVVDLTGGSIAIALLHTDTVLDGAYVADFNGDGLAEFLGIEAGAFQYTSQTEYSYARETDGNMAPAFASDACSASTPYCEQGARGVCEAARMGCTLQCTAIDGTEIASMEQGQELSCDGLDNDCDGRIDVLADRTISLSGMSLNATLVSYDMAATDSGAATLFELSEGTGASSLWLAELGADGSTQRAPLNLGISLTTGGSQRFLTAVDGATVHVVASTIVGLQHVRIDSAGPSTSPLGMSAPLDTADLVVLASEPYLVHATGGQLFVTPLSTQLMGEELYLASNIVDLAASVQGDSLVVALRTDDNKVLVASFVDLGGVLRLEDIHQPTSAAIDADVIGLEFTGRGATSCLTYVEQSTTGQKRLRALQVGHVPGRMTPGALETLSLRDVATDSVATAASANGCHVTWTEQIPGVDIVLAKDALLGPDGYRQELAEIGAGAALRFAGNMDWAYLANVGALQTDAAGGLTLQMSPICGALTP